jgi:hypothetical protein
VAYDNVVRAGEADSGVVDTDRYGGGVDRRRVEEEANGRLAKLEPARRTWTTASLLQRCKSVLGYRVERQRDRRGGGGGIDRGDNDIGASGRVDGREQKSVSFKISGSGARDLPPVVDGQSDLRKTKSETPHTL